MGKKLKLFALAVFVAVIAYIYPTAKQKYVKHVKHRVEAAVILGKKVANLKILGKQVPWKFILPVAGVLLVLLYVRRRKKKLQKLKEEEERRKAELAAQYKALGGPILSAEQDNQPKTQPTTTTTTITETDDGDIGGRIQSFSEWSSTNTVNVFSLARAGFRYTGRGDVVECFQCQGTLKEWEPNDDPLNFHLQYYPNCEFVKKRVSEAEIEKLSCRKRIEDLLAASTTCVNKLKEMKQMKLSGDKTGIVIEAKIKRSEIN